jgi:hypothetical protein
MTAKHAPSTIFSLPIIILIAVGLTMIIATLLILTYFIKKRKRRRGYHYPLTENSVQAYNLEEDMKPETSGNGTQIVVSDSYNLVDG